MDIRLHAFSGLTGEHITRLEYASLDWGDSINEEGLLKAEVVERDSFVEQTVKPYGTIIAAIAGKRILHAGYVTHVNRDNVDNLGHWTVEAGGGSTILDKRLVMNYSLNSSWKNGIVIVDEDNPKGDWLFTIRGTYSDIVSKLISETKKWGDIPIIPATIQGGNSNERNYNSYDFATVLDRIKDITGLEDGPEVRFDPYLTEDWHLAFKQVTATEIIDNYWKLNANLPDSGITVMEQDTDGEDMCTQCYASGGKDDDKLLVARSVSDSLIKKGYPVLQIANTQHSSVSELSTLLSYARADTAAGDTPQMVYGLKADLNMEFHVGDWIDLRCEFGLLSLKVVDIAGNARKSYQTLECRERL